MSNRLSCLGALAAFIVAALLSPFSRVAGSKGKNFYLYDFCIMKCKMALLLSAFAFAPSVLAEVPLATLSVDNIQVRAEWRVVPQDNPDFRMEGNTLVFQSNITGAGKPNGATIIATVEVLDKFSTLNPLYEDLTTRVKITTVVMGCHAHLLRNFAKSYDFSGWIAVQHVHSNHIEVEDVIYSVTGGNGYKQSILSTVTARHSTSRYSGRKGTKFFIQTSPPIPSITKWDIVSLPSGYHYGIRVNKAANCFDKDIKAIQEQNAYYLTLFAKQNYLNLHAPKLNTGVFAGGVYAGDQNVNARVISVATAFTFGSRKTFKLTDLKLASIINELYPITVINDANKAFIIDGSATVSGTYEYSADVTDANDGVDNTTPHEVIIVNSCPTRPPVSVPVWFNNGNSTLRINPSGISEVASYPYVLIKGDVYKYNGALPADGYSDVPISIGGFSPSGHPGKVWFADHFLCESI